MKKDSNLSKVDEGEESKSNRITVAVRCRPFRNSEEGQKEIVEVLEENVVVLLDPSPEEHLRQNRSKEKQYAFDYVFDKHASQDYVFEKTTKSILEGVVEGFNGTIFAYGSTGAGKTYTMLGETQNPGLMLLTFNYLFSLIEELSETREFNVKLSYLEIYNEVIKDLLSPNQEGLDIREDSNRGVVVSGLSEMSLCSPQEIINKVQNANRFRTCEPTKANETSSRSHAVLQVNIEHRDSASGTEAEVLVGKLNLIDLAGSERASNTQNRGLRLLEGANINRSLLALGNCINALFESQQKGVKNFVPYRDSKLTRLLKDSLGGNCRTVMVACISPNSSAFEDTQNTLKYANRAKNIKTSVQRNTLNVEYHISRYSSIINQLKKEIYDLRHQGVSRKTVPSYNTEKEEIEVKNHFQKEAEIRKQILEDQRELHELEIAQVETQNMLDVTEEDSSKFEELHLQTQILKAAISDYKTNIVRFQDKLTKLENRRKNFELKWKKLRIPEPYYSKLSLQLKDHLLSMSFLDIERSDKQKQAIINHKDMYIKYLEEQLKKRDSIIDQTKSILDSSNQEHSQIKNAISRIKIFEKSHVSYKSESRMSKGSSMPNLKLKKNQSTHIPKPKSLSNKAHNYQRNETSKIPFKKKLNFYSPSNKTTAQLNYNSTSNSEETTFTKRQPKIHNLAGIKVSEKFYKSPYVSGKPSQPTQRVKARPGLVLPNIKRS